MRPVSHHPRERQPLVLVVSSFFWRRHVPAAALLMMSTLAPTLSAQVRPVGSPRADVLDLAGARAAAMRLDPAIRAAREAVIAAEARERQAAALANPTLNYGREQTSRAGQSNAQDIAQIEWPVDVAGQRAARVAAARFRREAAEARLTAAAQALDAAVLRAFVESVSTAHRVELAEAAYRTAMEAQRVTDERVRAGDVAGYAGRRLRLEAGRYAARRAEAAAQARANRERLALLIGLPAAQILLPTIAAPDSTGTGFSALLTSALGPAAMTLAALADASDSLVSRAVTNRADVLIAQRDAQAAQADARLASRERVPLPAISVGYKGERIQSGATVPGVSLYGFVAGFSVPLPLLDRRAGAVSAADATARQVDAEADIAKRRVSREVLDALNALRSSEAEHTALQPFVGVESRLALRAVQAAYAEGEITLTEWLEALRAWQETELAVLTLTTDIVLRRAELARAVGLSLFPPTESNR
jgi:outer membrane protein, heavy metal efflux system